MRPQTFLPSLVFLSLVASCGGSDDIVCGEGTEEAGGMCLAIAPDGGGPDSPAARRPCTDPFGPVAAGALFVDGNYIGSDSDGSEGKPYVTIQEAIDSAAAGQDIGIAAAKYDENLKITSSLSIEGRCARDVVILGTIEVENTEAVAIRGLTIDGGTPGIRASNVVGSSTGAIGLDVRFVVATNSIGAGIEIDASNVRIQDSDVTFTRAVDGAAIRQRGSGIFASNGSFFDLRSSIIQMNGFIGVDVADAVGLPAGARVDGPSNAAPTLASSGIIQMNGIIGNPGGGVLVGDSPAQAVPGAGTPLVEILGNTLTDNGATSVVVRGARANLVGNAITAEGAAAQGVHYEQATGSISNNDIENFKLGAITIESSLAVGIISNRIKNNTEVGVLSHNSDSIVISGNTISGTISNGTNQNSGHGIYAYADSPAQAGQHDITGNAIIDNAGVGIGIKALSIGDEATLFLSVTSNEISRNGLAGIALDGTHAAEIKLNTLTANVGHGMRCRGARGSISRVFFDDNTVTATTVSNYGDDGSGVLMQNCHVSVANNQLTDNARFGVAFAEDSSGGCTDNILYGQPVDVVMQDSAGMAAANNTSDGADAASIETIVPVKGAAGYPFNDIYPIAPDV